MKMFARPTTIKSKLLIGWIALMLMVSSLGALPATHTYAQVPSPDVRPAPPVPIDPSPTPIPTFSCCERDIHVTGSSHRVRSARTSEGIKIQLRVNMNLKWFCEKKEDTRCLAFYRVSRTNNNTWEMFDGNRWVPVPDRLIRVENITPAPPLVSRCDGQRHAGRWGYVYTVVIDTPNPVRNRSLEFNWEVPPEKGTSYYGKVFRIPPIR